MSRAPPPQLTKLSWKKRDYTRLAGRIYIYTEISQPRTTQATANGRVSHRYSSLYYGYSSLTTSAILLRLQPGRSKANDVISRRRVSQHQGEEEQTRPSVRPHAVFSLPKQYSFALKVVSSQKTQDRKEFWDSLGPKRIGQIQVFFQRWMIH